MKRSNLISPESTITPSRIMSLRSRDILYSTSRKIRARRTPRTNQTPATEAVSKVISRVAPVTVMAKGKSSLTSSLEGAEHETGKNGSEKERIEIETIVRKLKFSNADMAMDDDNNDNNNVNDVNDNNNVNVDNNDNNNSVNVDNNNGEQVMELEGNLPQIAPDNQNNVSSPNVSISNNGSNNNDEDEEHIMKPETLPPSTPDSKNSPNDTIRLSPASVGNSTPKTRIPSTSATPMNANVASPDSNNDVEPTEKEYPISPLKSDRSINKNVSAETESVSTPVPSGNSLDDNSENASLIENNSNNNSADVSLSELILGNDDEMQKELEETLNLCRRADVDVIVSKNQKVCERTRENKINKELRKFLVASIILSIVFYMFYHNSNSQIMEQLFNNFAGLSLVLSFNMLLLFLFKKFQRVNITVDERLDCLLTERGVIYNRCLRLSEVANSTSDPQAAEAFIGEKNRLEAIENEIVSFYKTYYSQ